MAAKQENNRLTLKAKQLAHECPAWCLAWLPDPEQDIIFTGGADGTIKRWNISGTASKHAGLFEDNDGDLNMNGDSKENDDTDIKYELTNTGKKSVGISPITDIKCVPVQGQQNYYLLSTVSVDSFVRVYAINTNNSKLYQSNQNKNQYGNNDENSAGIDEYKTYDMNERHKVYLCDQNGKRSPAQYLEQYGGCWSSDINSDCSIIATGDQFGQIYLWSLYSEDESKKVPTVVKLLCFFCFSDLICFILALILLSLHK